jgi:hypothetical protein
MMSAAMPRPVAILKSPPEPVEVRIARLGLSKARQKRLQKIMDKAWARLENAGMAQAARAPEVKEKHQNAPAAD